jgi:hypothetical protein
MSHVPVIYLFGNIHTSLVVPIDQKQEGKKIMLKIFKREPDKVIFGPECSPEEALKYNEGYNAAVKYMTNAKEIQAELTDSKGNKITRNPQKRLRSKK